MTDAQKMEIALMFVHSLKQRDPLLLKTVLTEDAVWLLPGTSLVSGEAIGADAIVARGQLLGEHGVHFELLHVIYGDEGMGIMLHNTSKCKGKVLDEYLCPIFKLAGNKVHAIDTYISDVPMLNDYIPLDTCNNLRQTILCRNCFAAQALNGSNHAFANACCRADSRWSHALKRNDEEGESECRTE